MKYNVLLKKDKVEVMAFTNNQNKETVDEYIKDFGDGLLRDGIKFEVVEVEE